jgi:pimeloyl-ACP methyl ester carboxylesterase
VRPIVLGVSGGGFVAMRYASRHPAHPAAVILASTQARLNHARSVKAFGQLGGPEAELAAAGFLQAPLDMERAVRFGEICLPLYNPHARTLEERQRSIFRPELFASFHAYPDGTWHTFDLRGELRKIQCPTLIMAGEVDPITPLEDSLEIAAAMAPGIARLVRFAGCGHGVWQDDPERAFDLIREFIHAVHSGD